jgi:hypothetical protein
MIEEKIEHARSKKEARIRSGAEPTVAGWQCFLEEMLVRLERFFVPGNMITFQNLQEEEQRLFERLRKEIPLFEGTCAVFLPPSVLKAMTGGNSRPETVTSAGFAAISGGDAGIVLAVRCAGNYRVIANSLLAFPPYAPGIDIYEEGRLLAGYAYNTVDECIGEMAQVFRTYLK